MTEKNCCDLIDPKDWDEKEIVWENKKFVTDQVKCFMSIPVDMKQKMQHNMNLIKAADAKPGKFLMLTDGSKFKMDIYIDVTKDVPDAKMTEISGSFLTKVFDGPFTDIGKWKKAMQQYVLDQEKELKKLYVFFTACPKCAEKYGHNYVVLFAQTS